MTQIEKTIFYQAAPLVRIFNPAHSRKMQLIRQIVDKSRRLTRNFTKCLMILPGSIFAHFTTWIICLPARRFKVESRYSAVSGFELSYPAYTISGSMLSRILTGEGVSAGEMADMWGTSAVFTGGSVTGAMYVVPSSGLWGGGCCRCCGCSSCIPFNLPSFLDFRAVKTKSTKTKSVEKTVKCWHKLGFTENQSRSSSVKLWKWNKHWNHQDLRNTLPAALLEWGKEQKKHLSSIFIALVRIYKHQRPVICISMSLYRPA